MSDQAKILTELHEIIANILKSGTASVEEGTRIEELETLLLQQKCYKEIDHKEYTYQGEEIAGLLSTGHTMEAIEKMCTWEITPDDFFGFIQYHDEDEEFINVFTSEFIAKVKQAYQAQCQ